MKKTMLVLVLGLLITATATALARGGPGRSGGSDEAPPTVKLTDKEKADLLYIREEEKLARDVYLTLYDTHQLRIFKNISEAEQRHMDALLSLLTKYEIPDPVGNRGRGKFKDKTLKALYKKLVATGKTSVIDALTVGATIEDLDIHDLVKNLKNTEKTDLRAVYQNLMKGSRNHMRAFSSQLTSREVTYEPTHISKEDYEAIVNSPWERGPVDSEGRSRGRGHGGGRGRGNGYRGGR
jgi:hypothetical protein